MKNKAFLIWMLGFQLLAVMHLYLLSLVPQQQTSNEGSDWLNNLVWLVIYLRVGYLLFEGRHIPKTDNNQEDAKS